MPGTPSGENHSDDNQKCGRNVRPRAASSSYELRDARLEPAALDRRAADRRQPHVEQRLVGQVRPSRRGQRRGHAAATMDVGRSRRVESRIICAVYPAVAGGLRHAGYMRPLVESASPVSCSRSSRPAPAAFAGQATPTAALQTRTQTAQTPPPEPGPDAAAANAADRHRRRSTYKETVVVSASKTEQQLVDAPATMTVIGARDAERRAVGQLRRPPAQRAGRERHADLRARHQRHQPRRHQLAGDVAAHGRRRTQRLSGLLRLHDVGLHAVESRRDQAHRSHSRTGVGRLGRQRAQRRRQRHHQVAARDGRARSVDVRRRRASTAKSTTTARRAARSSTCAARTRAAVNDRWAYKISAGIVLPPTRCARPIGSDPERHATTPYPTVHEQRHAAAEARRPRGLRLRRRRSASCSFRGGVGGTDGMMHTGIGPFDIDRGATMGYWKVELHAARRCTLQAFMNVLDGDATNLVSVDPTGAADRARLRHQDVRRRARRHARLVAGKHVLTYGGNLRYQPLRADDRARRGQRAPRAAPTSRTSSSVDDKFRSSPARASTSSARSTTPCFRRASRWSIKPTPDQSVRVTYNRAFRAPSMVNNNLNTTIGTPLPLGAINPAFGSSAPTTCRPTRSAIRI